MNFEPPTNSRLGVLGASVANPTVNSLPTNPKPNQPTSAAERPSRRAALVSGLLVLLCVLCVSVANASLLTLSLTNQFGLPDTNVIRVVQTSTNTPTADNGSIITIGLPVRVTPNSNGVVSIYRVTGNYTLYGTTLGAGVVYRFPDSSSNATAYKLSGFNTFETVVITSTNIYTNNATLGAGVITGSGIGTNVTLAQLPSAVVTNGINGFRQGSQVIFSYTTTNPVYIGNGYTHPEYSGFYAFSPARGVYTNYSDPTKMLWFDYSFSANWVIGSQTNDPSSDANAYYYAGSQSFPTNDVGNWSDTNGTIDGVNVGTSNKTVASMMFTNGVLTRYVPFNNSVSYNIVYDANENMFERTDYEDNNHDKYPRYTSFGVPFDNYYKTSDVNGGGDGVTVYRQNGAANYINSDNRGYVVLAVVYGDQGTNGSISEYLTKRKLSYTAGGGGVFTHPLKLDSLGHVGLGNNPEAEHTLDYPFPNGWVTIRKGTTDAAQLLLEGPTPAPTLITNGGFWNDGSRVWLNQNGRKSPIPIMQATNANLTAATTFTWTFTSPFGNTNYSVVASGAGATLVAPIIGAKTTNSVVISFTAFTGILNAMAIQ